MLARGMTGERERDFRKPTRNHDSWLTVHRGSTQKHPEGDKQNNLSLTEGEVTGPLLDRFNAAVASVEIDGPHSNNDGDGQEDDESDGEGKGGESEWRREPSFNTAVLELSPSF